MRVACQTLPYANVYVDTNLKVVHVEWDGLVPSYVFRQTILCVLEAIQKRDVYGCIFDLTKLKSIPQQEQHWLIEEILPVLTTTTLHKIAFLESFNRKGHLDLSDLVYSSVPVIPFEFQYFEDEKAALEWLCDYSPLSSKYEYAQPGRSMPFA